MSQIPLFNSFFIAGFECSTHRPRRSVRLDLIAATGHDRFATADYLRLREYALLTARDGIRWHLIEQSHGRYDFSSVLPMVRAAHDAGIQIIWDLCHYGWPDSLDIFAPEFVSRYAGLARAFAQLLASESDAVPFFAPINEISFFAWAGGTVGYFNPFAEGRGDELKAQLICAAIAAMDAIWEVSPTARFVHTDPVIHVAADHQRPADREEAAAYTRAQFAAWDMLCGRQAPHLGGQMKYLDIIGVNYYPHNQWVCGQLPFNPAYALDRHDPRYRPFRHILTEVYQRYQRPIFVAETGSDSEDWPDWLRYICDEVQASQAAGVPVGGICLYPIVNFPWWDDDHIHKGLWDYADERGERLIFQPLADELYRQQVVRLSSPDKLKHRDIEEGWDAAI